MGVNGLNYIDRRNNPDGPAIPSRVADAEGDGVHSQAAQSIDAAHLATGDNMTVRPRGDGFQADFTYKGARYRAQFPTQQAARQWEADTNAALIGGRPLPQAPTGAMASDDITWGELFKKTIGKYWAGTKNEGGATRNAQDAVNYFGTNTNVSTTNAAKIDDYVTHLQKQGLTGATINRRLAAVSKMFRYAHRVDAITSRPIIERQPEGDGRERYLREPEAEGPVV
jgi:hypothetical protein